MTKAEMAALIMSKIDAKVAAAGKQGDWTTAKGSVLAQILDGITDGLGEIAEGIQATVPSKEKINEIIYNLNMVERKLLNMSPTAIPVLTDIDKLGPITPLT